MKKKIILIIISIILLNVNNVLAQDNTYSLNKFNDEVLEELKISYNNNLKQDGFILIGKSLVKEEDNYQTIITKYKKDGSLSWYYTHPLINNEYNSLLEYSYDDNNNIDGYLIIIKYNQEDFIKQVFIKLDLDGKVIFEKETQIEEDIIKIIINSNNDYIVLANKDNQNEAKIICYDKQLNIKWQRSYFKEGMQEVKFLDITEVNNSFYTLLRKSKDSDNLWHTDILHYDLEGNELKVLETSLDELETYHLQSIEEGYIVYGITPLVKLPKEQPSYYLLKYNTSGELLWEVVGDTALSKEDDIKLISIDKQYLLLYKNSLDSSYEVIELDNEGLFQKKTKKIKNNYYIIKNFYSMNNTLYFLGQITNPEEDNLEYANKSLFLISDEDKVIEVKTKDSTNLLIISSIFIVLTIVVIFLKRKKKV